MRNAIVNPKGELPVAFLKLPGGTVVRYCDHAPGTPVQSPPIVLLHGANVALESWTARIERLGGTYRLIAVDLPGHGETGATVERDYSVPGMVKFVDAFVGAIGLDRPFILAGHSHGGHLAWRFALEHSEKLANLILVAPAGLAEPGGPQGRIYRLARRPGGPLLLRLLASPQRLAAGLAGVYHDKSRVTEAMADRYWTFSRRPGTFAATIARIRAPGVEPSMVARLPEIKLPTLIIWGNDDPVFPVHLANDLTQAMSNARLVTYEACGHFPMDEAADRSVADVRAFLAT